MKGKGKYSLISNEDIFYLKNHLVMEGDKVSNETISVYYDLFEYGFEYGIQDGMFCDMKNGKLHPGLDWAYAFELFVEDLQYPITSKKMDRFFSSIDSAWEKFQKNMHQYSLTLSEKEQKLIDKSRIFVDWAHKKREERGLKNVKN